MAKGLPVHTPTTCLHVSRTWLNVKFQVRFKTVAYMWLVDMPLCLESSQWCVAHFLDLAEMSTPTGVTMDRVTLCPCMSGADGPCPRAVHSKVSRQYPGSKIPQTKPFTPVIKHDPTTQQNHRARAQALGQSLMADAQSINKQALYKGTLVGLRLNELAKPSLLHKSLEAASQHQSFDKACPMQYHGIDGNLVVAQQESAGPQQLLETTLGHKGQQRQH